MSMVFCRGCGKEINESAVSCPHCGAAQSRETSSVGKKQGTAFLLALLLGWLGGHRFYLGNIGLGVLYLFTFGLFGIGTLVDLFKLAFMRPEVFAEKFNKGTVGQPIGIWAKLVWCVFILFFIGFYQEIFIGIYHDYNRADKFSKLATATPAQVSPSGELAAMFNLMSDNTDLQRENKFQELKEKVVEWTLPVYEVKKVGDVYIVQTGAVNTVGTIIYVTARNDQEKAIVEALKTGSYISFKGIISGVAMRHLVIKPAFLFHVGNSMMGENQAATIPPADSRGSCDATGNELWYEYEPNIVTLKGKLISAKGETPDEEEISYPALQLDNPISVRGNGGSIDSESGVTLIQLALNEQLWPIYKKSKGANVTVTGTLYQRASPYHYTNVLFTATQIVSSKPLCH